MKILDLLESHITEMDLCPGAHTYPDWKTKAWLQIRLGEHLIPIFPMWPIRDALCKHDVHHILTGYATDMKGEAELAAWELGSGGCHYNLLFWLDRVSFVVIGLFSYPRATLRALLDGSHCVNLFPHSLAEIENWPVEHTKKALRLTSW